MATAPINKPKAIQYLNGGTPSQRGKQPVVASGFEAYQFVYLDSGNSYKLNKCPASQSSPVVYGLALENAGTTTDEPITTLYAGYSNPLDVNDTYFLVNITDGSGTVGSGTTTQAAVNLGASYEMIYGGSGYTNIQMLNAAATTDAFFKVEALWAEDSTSTYNGRVICSIVATRQ